ncbi:MAG: hypothetical protein DKM50_11115 [Candidatus Margulisiibacteriota bacterium]|nr:MAG: hypothetical protein A2X43_12375 [Candidatus Margulisbacteria bacterium GWD2_39_127]OGI03250.1 MAG: hypothetical protein A2X42_11615 [Candidatus Margulisbacteria bacterium GWF2_38_17]OGI11273.1 MAG: hypothetical protein A2X41_04040 [Candidatus Margulisbacteria bacterium GWE2_39_32]PZM78506.1 MAG: hypothetical protein DKM50_11115 [Candidatus Margulisiibacteriota bacterium]HAR63929.1 hypothetical protein [Candidatus Margulisiibacteriota bacterium]
MKRNRIRFYRRSKLLREIEQYKAKLDILRYYVEEIKCIYKSKNEELQKTNEELILKNKTINEQFISLYEKEEELIVANKILKAKEEKLKLLNEEIFQIAQLKSDFLANMSHELRTPLNSILGFSDILVDDNFGTLTEKQRRFVINIQNSGKHLLELINDVLDLSKIESGKVEINVEDVLIEDTVEYVVETLSPLALKKNIELSVINKDNVNKIEADETKLRQVIFNVVGNAIKFTPEHGSVKIFIENYLPEVGAGFTKFTITDTGIGIKKEDYSKIFSEFEQIDSSYARENSGTGLGLALTKKLVEKHKGDIWFTSEYGKGTSFYIIIPKNITEKKNEDIWEEFSKFAPAVDYAQDLSFSLDSVLVYEPDEDNKERLSMILSEDGYRIIFIDNFENILDIVKKEEPLLILVNSSVLPDPDEVYSLLKNEQVLYDIPLLIMTDNDDKRLRYKYGISDVVLLPIDKVGMKNKIKSMEKKKNDKEARKEIVIIDDDINIIELVHSFFENDNIIVKGFSDSRQGLRYLANAPDLVLLDIIMPDLNGFELLKEVDRLYKKMDNIVIFSMKELNEEERKFLNKRVIKVIDKTNFSRETFVREINRLLSVLKQ